MFLRRGIFLTAWQLWIQTEIITRLLSAALCKRKFSLQHHAASSRLKAFPVWRKDFKIHLRPGGLNRCFEKASEFAQGSVFYSSEKSLEFCLSSFWCSGPLLSHTHTHALSRHCMNDLTQLFTKKHLQWTEQTSVNKQEVMKYLERWVSGAELLWSTDLRQPRAFILPRLPEGASLRTELSINNQITLQVQWLIHSPCSWVR